MFNFKLSQTLKHSNKQSKKSRTIYNHLCRTIYVLITVKSNYTISSDTQYISVKTIKCEKLNETCLSNFKRKFDEHLKSSILLQLNSLFKLNEFI